jgi:hypothetical protein
LGSFYPTRSGEVKMTLGGDLVVRAGGVALDEEAIVLGVVTAVS